MSYLFEPHALGFLDPSKYVVHITQNTSSWINLPSSLATRLPRNKDAWPVILQFQESPQTGSSFAPPIYLAWSGAISEFQESVGVPSAVARILHIPAGALLSVTPPMIAIPTAASITVEPNSPDDWEVIELNSGAVEAELLNQTAVVSKDQPLIVYVNKQPISFKVTAITEIGGGESNENSSRVARLKEGSEVHIAPRLRYPGENGGDGGDSLEEEEEKILRTALRLYCLKEADSPLLNHTKELDLPRGVYVALVSPATLENCGMKDGAWVELVAPRGGSAKACISGSAGIPPGHIIVSDIARASMGAEPFDSIIIRKLNKSEQILLAGSRTSLEHPPEDQFEPLEAIWQRFGGSESGYISENPINKVIPIGKWPTSHQTTAGKILDSILPILSTEQRSILQSWGSPRPGSVILSGPAASGKTSLLSSLCSILSSNPSVLAEVHTIHCREIHSEEDAEKKLSHSVLCALNHQPAVIILEDLDVLCPNASPVGGGGGGDGAPPGEEHLADQGSGIVKLISEILDLVNSAGERWVHKNASKRGACVGAWPAVAIIATCRDAAGVDPVLREVGRFETVVNIMPPTVEGRAEILEAEMTSRGLALLKDKNADDDENDQIKAILNSIAARADGFDGADLNLLIDRATHSAVSRQLLGQGHQKELQISAADFEVALNGLIPAAFWGSGTRAVVQAGVQGWQDVGGMSVVCDTLKEILEMPLRYANLVATAPLRLRTGALLYGPPGCGKTHVIAAAVAATGVRCITVSGPELLNKYIGASEAAVRDVFRRAAAAAPSVLFFDEFDAIAPQRGHDNTGVTDRVVNQLLTELDGVEGLRGVCVIAATSRPDLIDAALLRPGRLDRMLHCGFPTRDERLEILNALSRRLQLDGDVDFERIADSAEGFSGADLGAVLSDAQLAAAHEALERITISNGDHHHHHAAAVVGQQHLEAALATARPSVSRSEKQRLDSIYQRFESGSKYDDEPPPGYVNAGKKVSWA